MNIVLWVLQIFFGLVFLGSGVAKTLQPREKLAANSRMAWANDFTDQQVRTIGILEALGGIGLILPQLTGVLPWLTPLAALGLALTMFVAAGVHVRRKEPAAPNLVLLALMALIAVGRLWIVPA